LFLALKEIRNGIVTVMPECEIYLFFAEIFYATSAHQPRADVAYCIHTLARRLAKTRNWIVSPLCNCLNASTAKNVFG